MAYGDYIHCASCDCKLLYDGSRAGRDRLDDAYAEGQWEILCPPCLNTLRAKVAELEADLREYRNLAEALMEGNRSNIRLASDLLNAEAALALSREFVRKRGHAPGCKIECCSKCGWLGEHHDWDQSNQAFYGNHSHVHPFQPGPCDCGYVAAVGEE